MEFIILHNVNVRYTHIRSKHIHIANDVPRITILYGVGYPMNALGLGSVLVMLKIIWVKMQCISTTMLTILSNRYHLRFSRAL